MCHGDTYIIAARRAEEKGPRSGPIFSYTLYMSWNIRNRSLYDHPGHHKHHIYTFETMPLSRSSLPRVALVTKQADMLNLWENMPTPGHFVFILTETNDKGTVKV